MALILLRFEDGHGQVLGERRLPDDAPIRMLFPHILEELGLDEQEEWRLTLAELNQDIDLQYAFTFAEIGARDGSIIRIRPSVQRIGRYELVRVITEGGIGTVYEGYDAGLGRRVAIRVIRDEFARNQPMMRRLVREARVVAGLEGHPNVVDIYDFSYRTQETGDPPFVVSEYVDGHTLDQWIGSRKGLYLEEVNSILTGVAAALDAAHAKGIIHRDVRPSNIWLRPDQADSGKWIPQVADFAMVPLPEEMGQPVDTEDVRGGAYYMSPEQVKGEVVTPQSDVYALGVVVYEMLTGRRPFEDAPSESIAAAQVATPPPSLGQFRDVPAPLEAVVLKALSKDPGERYRTAGEFAQAFTRALAAPAVEPEAPAGVSQPPVVVPQGSSAASQLPARARRRAGVGRKVVLLGSGVLVVVAAAVAAIWFFLLRPGDGADLLQQAEQALAAGQYGEARALYEDLLQREPDNLEALRGLGQTYEEQENWSQAAAWYENWVQVAPDDPQARLKLGWAYFELQDYGRAAAEFARVTELQPTLVQGWEGLGWAYFQAQDLENAMPALQQWAQMAPDSVEAYQMIGQTAFQVADYPAAVSAFQQALTLEERPEIYISLSQAYAEAGDPDRALEAIEAGLALDPQRGGAYWQMGRIYQQQQRWQDAVDAFQQALDLGFEEPALFGDLGGAYRGLDMHEEALSAFVRWAELEPGTARAWAMIGWSHLSLGDYADAGRAFEQAIALEERAPFLFGLGESYRRAGDCERAIPFFERALEIDPSHENAAQSLGLCRP